ncbi:hypothetical protein GCM10027048_10450 [Hymenobacter coalescens]
MTPFLRKAGLLALLGTGISFSSYAQRGGNFLGFTTAENDQVSVNLAAPTGAFTLEAWVYFNGTAFGNAGSYSTVLEFGNDADWFGVNSLGQLEVYGVLEGGTVPVRTWTHVAYTWDGTTSRLYVNGTQVASAVDAPRQSGTSLGIGYNSGDSGWQGYIDEVAVWATARDAAGIQADMNNGPNPVASGLRAYYKFESVTNQQVANSVAGGPAGVLGSTPAAETNDPILTNQLVNSNRQERAAAVAQLQPNFPNPFVDHTTIPFVLLRPGHVRLSVLDLTGREVATLLDETRPAGSYAAPFRAVQLAAGVYLSQLTIDGQRVTRRMVVQ